MQHTSKFHHPATTLRPRPSWPSISLCPMPPQSAISFGSRTNSSQMTGHRKPYKPTTLIHSSIAPVSHHCHSTVNLISEPLNFSIAPVSYNGHSTVDFIQHRQRNVVNQVPCPCCSVPCPVCHGHCGCLACHVYSSHQTWGPGRSGLASSVVQRAGYICVARSKCFDLKFRN